MYIILETILQDRLQDRQLNFKGHLSSIHGKYKESGTFLSSYSIF